MKINLSKLNKSILVSSLLLFISFSSFAQQAPIRGEVSPGVYENLKSTSGVLQTIINSGTVTANLSQIDPCHVSSIAKLHAIINITSATTVILVSATGSSVVFVCGFAITISQVATTANTIKFVQGTGAACATGLANITGTFGAGGITAAAPIVIAHSGPGTIFKTAISNGLCATTTIGASASFQGVLTYVIAFVL